MSNKNGIVGIWDNAYMFVHSGKHVTLHLMKPKPPKRGSRESVTKEVLQVHHVYIGNVKKTRRQGETFYNPGE